MHKIIKTNSTQFNQKVSKSIFKTKLVFLSKEIFFRNLFILLVGVAAAFVVLSVSSKDKLKMMTDKKQHRINKENMIYTRVFF